MLLLEICQKDKRTGRPKIWLYKDKVTDEPKGDATVTYEDPHAAMAAVDWFNNKEFHGSIIGVQIAETKSKDAFDVVPNNNMATDFVAEAPPDEGVDGGAGRGRGRGDAQGKPWQQDGDWLCPNTRSVLIGEQPLLNSLSFPNLPSSVALFGFCLVDLPTQEINGAELNAP